MDTALPWRRGGKSGVTVQPWLSMNFSETQSQEQNITFREVLVCLSVLRGMEPGSCACQASALPLAGLVGGEIKESLQALWTQPGTGEGSKLKLAGQLDSLRIRRQDCFELRMLAAYRVRYTESQGWKMAVAILSAKTESQIRNPRAGTAETGSRGLAVQPEATPGLSEGPCLRISWRQARRAPMLTSSFPFSFFPFKSLFI